MADRKGGGFDRLDGPNSETDGFVVVHAWRGARLTLIVPTDGTTALNYSFVDSPDATAHDADSTATVAADSGATAIEVTWPFIAIDRSAGTGTWRWALV